MMSKKFSIAFFCIVLTFCFSARAQNLTGADAITPIASFDNGWFTVYKINDHVYAIGEIQYYQGNYSYLIVGNERALMLDAGASTDKDITKVIRALTDKPVSVLPTHLHFDHIGGLDYFKDIWLADTPAVHSFKRDDGQYYIPPTYTLGFIDDYDMKPVTVSRLITEGEKIDLGGVELTVKWVGGHNLDEVVIYDITDNMLFTGDYLYPGFMINCDTDGYLAATEQVLKMMNKDMRIFGAHTSSKLPNVVPELKQSDVTDLKSFLIALKDGKVKGEEIDDPQYKIKSAIFYPINDRLSFVSDIVWERDDASPCKLKK